MLLPNDKIKSFPEQYNEDQQTILDKLYFEENGEGSIKYTGETVLSGGLEVTGDIVGNYTGTLSASNVILSGGNNVEDTLSTIGTLNNAILDQVRDFERRAELIRKVTPSGFSNFGQGSTHVPTIVKSLSSANGLRNTILRPNTIELGRDDVFGLSIKTSVPDVVINGYKLKLKGIFQTTPYEDTPDYYFVNTIKLPEPPTSGTRQDLVFIESWKEEVDKETGLFFPFGNTQYAGTEVVDGTVITETQVGHTGSAYFTTDEGIYAVRANQITEAFISNVDHNIGILENGNYFQVRYRIRVEADVDSGVITKSSWKKDASNQIIPQGQFSTIPTRTTTGPQGVFFHQGSGTTPSITTTNFNNEYGLVLGGVYTGDNQLMSTVSGLSLDGFTYAIPVCAIHRRNTAPYGLDNLNGTAFENAWIIEVAPSGLASVNSSYNQSLISSNGSLFKVMYASSSATNDSIYGKVIRVSGTTSPSSTATWTVSDITYTDIEIRSVEIDKGQRLLGNNGDESVGDLVYSRPDSLYSDIIDRRDVLDLRHKVSLTGSFNEDELYQENYDVVMKGEFRQEWEEQLPYDADGNGLSTIDTGIYGNVIMETIGLGSTIPDSHIYTDVTRATECNNGIGIGFNGSRTVFRDDVSNETNIAVIIDQSSPQVLDSVDNMVTFNSVSKDISIDMTQHSSYINNIIYDPTLLGSHLPVVKWGNGANVAGVWTRTDDYHWTFDGKEFGAIALDSNVVLKRNIGDIYRDLAGNDWEVILNNTTDIIRFLPVYSTNDGSVLPIVGDVLTLQSGSGVATINEINGAGSGNPEYVSSSGVLSGVDEFPIGYSNSAHGTTVTESITLHYKVNYKAGSSCLKYLPYTDGIKGAEVFIDGDDVNLPNLQVGMSKDKKNVQLQGLYSETKTSLYGLLLVESSSLIISGDTASGIFTHSSFEDYLNRKDAIVKGNPIDVTGLVGVTQLLSFSSTILKVGGVYVTFVYENGPGNKIFAVTSPDLVTWTATNSGNPVLAVGYTSYGMHFIYEDGIYKIINNYHSGDRTYPVLFTLANLNTTAIYIGDCKKFGDNVDPVFAAWNENNDIFSFFKDGDIYRASFRLKDASHTYLGTSTDMINWSLERMYSFEAYAIHRVGNKYYNCYNTLKTGIYALSAPSSEYSTTGVYANTAPQIKTGFKSTDSVILHYERLASQQKTDLTTIETMNTKDMFVHNGTTSNGGVSFSNSLIWYAHPDQQDGWIRVKSFGNPDKPLQNVLDHLDVLKTRKLEDNLYSLDVEEFFKGLVKFPLKNITPIVANHLLNENNQTTSNIYEDIHNKYPLTPLYSQHSSVYTYGFITTMSNVKRTDGSYWFFLNNEHETGNSRTLGYSLGVLVNDMQMIGRPLVK